MILYHGTNYKSLVQIQKQGLLSKIHHGKSNWDHSVPSNPHFIYLTDAYAMFYAQKAAGGTDDYPVIIRVETGNATLYPDDDFIGQALWRQMTETARELYDNSLITFTKTIDIEVFQKFALESLNRLGNCAVKRLKGSNSLVQAAIIRNKNLCFRMGGDPCIHPMNYQLLGHYYRTLMQFFFREVEFPVMFPDLEQPVKVELTKFEDWKIELIDLR